jgi:multidrug efflux system membrane fusion protein
VDALLHAALNNAGRSVALALTAAAGARIWRQRPAVAHALWLLVLLKLVTPSLPQFPVRWGQVPRQAAPEPAVPLATNRPAAVSEPTSIPHVGPVVLAPTADVPPRHGEERGASAPARAPAVATTWPWRAAVACIWLTGAVVCWSVVWLATARMRRLVLSAHPNSPELAQRLADLAGRIGLRRSPAAWIVPSRIPPMLWVPFFGRPRLVLPEELWGRLDPMQQDAILTHELAHLRRRDHWVRRLEAAVLGLYWWDPVAWWARREVERAEEECCDARVVELLPWAVGAYAEALVATAVYLSGARRPLPLGASGVGRLDPIKRRLQMILFEASSAPAARKAPRAVLVLGLLALPFLPAVVSGNPARAPATQKEPAGRKSAEKPSPPRTGDPKEPDGAQKAEGLKEEPPPAMGRLRVKASRPIRREIRDYEEFAGSVDSVMTVSIRPRVSGVLIGVHCQPGQKVRKGNPLFEIDRRSYQAEVEKARAEVQVAKARLEAKEGEIQRANIAEREGSVAAFHLRSERRAAEASVEAAEKSLELARLNLEFTELESPIDGTVLGPVVQAGNVAVADNTALATIVSTDPMYVYFDVPQNLVLKFNRQRIEGKLRLERGKGLSVRVGLSDEADFPREGTVDSLNGAVDPNTGAARWRAKVPNRDELLLPGMFARVRLPLGEPHQALLVPEQAVYSDQGAKFVVVVSENGVAEIREVTIGSLHEGTREVKTGLKGDEWVVISSPQKSTAAVRRRAKIDVDRVPIPEGSSARSQPPQ